MNSPIEKKLYIEAGEGKTESLISLMEKQNRLFADIESAQDTLSR